MSEALTEVETASTLALIRSRTPLRTPNALTRTMLELIASGELAVSVRLPTVREVAAALEMSPSSVAQAWGGLASRNVIETKRRGGTTVLGPPMAPRATRFDRMMRASSGMPVDLGNLTTDLSLVPNLEAAVVFAATNPLLHAPVAEPITPELRAAVQSQWPFSTEHFLATHGGVDAIELALASSIGPGDRVIVDSPTLARVLDILESIGATAIPIDYLEDGPDLRQLTRALTSKPSAMLFQPAGGSPSGKSVSEEWLASAAKILTESGFPILEVVQTPFLQLDSMRSLGSLLPQRVVHIQAYNFFYGSDLRVAVAGGAEEFIERMWFRLTYSSRWVSRLLQNALAFQLTNPVAVAARDSMVVEYSRRHEAFTEALINVGFKLGHRSGPSIWLPVPDEHSVCTRMSRRGVLVHPGSMFVAEPPRDQFVHINGTALKDGYKEMAAVLAAACEFRAG
jgi:DNA-binding transcriptional MocR family regulator